MNGAILGMRKQEIDRKFDEIVAFAEVEKFLDTPVKHYSSGMYVRLAFAVAAHLEPEILIVDEVLAVGDAKFQARCLGKMQEVAGRGRTVVFVSHNMAAVTRFCPRCIWLDQGKLREFGEASSLVSKYLSLGTEDAGQVLFPAESAPGSEYIRLLAVRTKNARGETTTAVASNEPLSIELEYENSQRHERPAPRRNLDHGRRRRAPLDKGSRCPARRSAPQPGPLREPVRAATRLPQLRPVLRLRWRGFPDDSKPL